MRSQFMNFSRTSLQTTDAYMPTSRINSGGISSTIKTCSDPDTQHTLTLNWTIPQKDFTMSAPVVGQQQPGGGKGTVRTKNNPPEFDNEIFDNTPVDEVILATGGYDHTIKFWQAHTGKRIIVRT